MTERRFPDGTPVAVRYPTSRADGEVWFAGTIVGQLGPDEWEVAVNDPRVASGRENSPLIRCGSKRLRILADREWIDLVDEADRAIRRQTWLNKPFPPSGQSS